MRGYGFKNCIVFWLLLLDLNFHVSSVYFGVCWLLKDQGLFCPEAAILYLKQVLLFNSCDPPCFYFS